MTQFLYKDAPAGSGKSYGAISAAIRTLLGKSNSRERFLFVVPSIKLINEYLFNKSGNPDFTKYCTTDITNSNKFRVGAIHSDNYFNVTNALINEMQNPTYDILFVTHASFLSYANYPNKNIYNVVVDEIMEIVSIDDYNFSQIKTIALQHIDLTLDNTGNFYELNVSQANRAAFQRDRIDTNDSALSGVRMKKFFNLIQSTYAGVRISKEDINRFATISEKDSISVISSIMPTYFDSWNTCVFLAANFKSSIQYLYWTTLGVKFSDWTDLKLRYTAHDISNKSLSIEYVLNQQDMSKNVLTKAGFYSVLTNAIEADIKGNFLYTHNNSRKGQDFTWYKTAGTKLPPKAQGFNEYQNDYHTAVFLAAINFDNKTKNLLTDLIGCTTDDLRDANMHEAAYQFVFRTSLRDPDSTEPVRFIVGDKKTAEYVGALIPGSTVKYLDLGITGQTKQVNENKKAPMTGAERTRKSREKKKALKGK